MVRAHYKDVCAFENGDFDDLGPNAQNSYRRRIAVILTALSTAGFVVVPKGRATELYMLGAKEAIEAAISRITLYENPRTGEEHNHNDARLSVIETLKAMLLAYEEKK